ncbi:hypothetical protein ABGB12_23475 [Actinocorallia sp. B10E7]
MERLNAFSDGVLVAAELTWLLLVPGRLLVLRRLHRSVRGDGQERRR